MKNIKINAPFFVFNPKSYLFGEELLELAITADQVQSKYEDITVIMTVPFADILNIANNTKRIIVSAQHVDGIVPGTGMGHVLPESVYNAGARASFINHAEKPLELSEIVAGIKRLKNLKMASIACADSLEEAKAISMLRPDVILCEPTELIGTGQTSDEKYIKETNEAIKLIDKNILVMQAAGITTPEDVYRTIYLGSDGTGCTSGIVKADDPKEMIKLMIEAAREAFQER